MTGIARTAGYWMARLSDNRDMPLDVSYAEMLGYGTLADALMVLSWYFI